MSEKAAEMNTPGTIFITGAAAGIGRETAKLFYQRGYALGLYDIAQDLVEELAAELGPSCATGRLDVTDADAFARAVEAFQARFGRMDVLFNNAGMLRMGRFAEVPLATHRRTIDINVQGVINGIWSALPLLRATAKAHGQAHIISMCSASAVYGMPDHTTYSASKSAVRALTEALSIELQADGIIVSDIIPGYVDTDMVRDQDRPSNILKKMGVAHTPAQIAELVWLAASGNRLHYFGRRRLALNDRLARLLPGVARRALVRRL